MEPNGLIEIIPANTVDHEKSSSREIAVKELSRMVYSTEKPVDCLFFKVPEPIRRVRSECYEPQLISLGLYGRTNKQCSMMENVKLEVASAVLKVLLNSTELAKIEIHSRVSGEGAKVTAMWNHLCDHLVPPDNEGDDIWKQYSDAPQNLTLHDVQHQLVLDAIFLVSFMLFQHADPRTKSFGIDGFEKYKILLRIFTRAEILCNINALNSDIWLFENQIPLRLIRRMVRVMYLDEGEESSSSAQKKAAADHEQAFEKLIRQTFQKALRVLPGNYRTRSRSKTEGPTDRMLKSKTLKQRSHLLECLYKLVCSRDAKVSNEETEEGENLNYVDSLDKARTFTEEEGVRDRKRLDRWKVNNEETEEGENLNHVDSLDKARTFTEEEGVRDRKRLDSRSGGRSDRVLDEESKQKSFEFSRMTGHKHQNELGSDSEEENVQDKVGLQRPWPPSLQEFEGAAEQRANSSASQMELDQEQVRGRRAPREQSRSVPNTKFRLSSQQTSTAAPTYVQNGSRQAEASEGEEQPGFCCLQNSTVTSMCCGETAILIDSYILPTVTVLREVGILVKSDTSPGCHCKVELKNSFLPWGNATLHISPLHVDGISETLLRNLLVHEKVNPDKNKLITYLQCLDDLIDTERDVSLLKQGRHPVILNSSLDEKDVAALFNKLLDGSRMYYNPELEAIRRAVRSYNLQQWRRLLTEIRERYWNGRKPWLACSVLAAFSLLAFTLVQTVYSALGFYKKS